MIIEGLEAKLDFAGMTGVYLHELWKYHGQVRTELKSALLEFRSTGLPDDVKGLMCTRRNYQGSYSTTSPQWPNDYINSIAQTVAGTPQRHIFDLTEFENVVARHISSFGQCSCATMPSQVKWSFWEALTAIIQRTLEKVRRNGVTKPHCDS